MPLAGVWISRGEMNFPFVLILSVIAGVIGSWVLYFLGFYGGNFLLDKYTKKFPKQKNYIDEKLEYLRSKSPETLKTLLNPVEMIYISLRYGDNYETKTDFAIISKYTGVKEEEIEQNINETLIKLRNIMEVEERNVLKKKM